MYDDISSFHDDIDQQRKDTIMSILIKAERKVGNVFYGYLWTV